jgi:2-dehydro-3-deoxyphosphogluconate aldolase / (4S)-4-hydroxy-2-oxoglutarate aldolase
MTDTALPHLPGVATVLQILSAREAEYTEPKILPDPGRANDIKSIRSARFWPTGGISTTNAAQYLALPNVG